MTGPIREFYAEITGSADGLIRAAGQGEAAAGSLERKVGGLGNSFAVVGKSATEHVGGVAAGAMGKLESAGDKVFGKIGSIIGNTARMGASFALLGAAGGAAGFLFSAAKSAEDFNVKLAGLKNAAHDAGVALPTGMVDNFTNAMLKLGIDAPNTVQAMQQMTEAGVPLKEQMDTLTAAANLMSSGLSNAPTNLNDSLSLVMRAAEGQGRALLALGLQLPPVVPKVAALAHAQDALTKAQEKYGVDSPQYQAALEKVGKITAEMHSPFQNLSQVTGELNTKLGGAAQTAANVDPWLRLKAEYKDIAVKAGETLLPALDKIATWTEAHMPQIEKGMTTAFHDIGIAAHDVGGFIKNDLWPPLHTAFDYIGAHPEVQKILEGVATALGAIYLVKKATSPFASLIHDLGSVLGLAGRVTGIGGGGAGGSAMGVRVWGGPVEVTGLGRVPGGAPTPVGGPGGGGFLGLLGKAGPFVGDAAAGGLIMSGLIPGTPSPSEWDKQSKAQWDAYNKTTANLQATAHVSAAVAQLWQNVSHQSSEWSDITKGDFAQQAGFLGDTDKAAGEIRDLYNAHKLTSASQLAQVVSFWNDTLKRTGGIPPTVQQIEAYLQTSVSAIATLPDNLRHLTTASFNAAQAADNLAGNMYAANQRGPGGRPHGTASGGEAFGLTLVGEHGPELLNLHGDYVHQNFGGVGFGRMPSGGALSGNGGSGPIYVTGPVYVSGVEDIAQLADQLRRHALERGAIHGQPTQLGHWA